MAINRPSKSYLSSGRVRKLPPIKEQRESPVSSRAFYSPAFYHGDSMRHSYSEGTDLKSYEHEIQRIVNKYLGDAHRSGYGASGSSDVYRNCPCCADRNLRTIENQLPSETWHLDQNPYYYTPRYERSGVLPELKKSFTPSPPQSPPAKRKQEKAVTYYRPETTDLSRKQPMFSESQFVPKATVKQEYDPRYIYLTQPSQLDLYKLRATDPNDWGYRHNHTLVESVVDSSARYYQSMDRLKKSLHQMF